MTLPNAFEIDQRHLGNICSEKELAEKQCAGPHADRQGDDRRPRCWTSRSAGPVYAVSGSGGLPRLAFILNGQVTLIPRADTDDRSAGACRRPRRSSPTLRSAISS